VEGCFESFGIQVCPYLRSCHHNQLDPTPRAERVAVAASPRECEQAFDTLFISYIRLLHQDICVYVRKCIRADDGHHSYSLSHIPLPNALASGNTGILTHSNPAAASTAAGVTPIDRAEDAACIAVLSADESTQDML
jgi:hypothetical protein